MYRPFLQDLLDVARLRASEQHPTPAPNVRPSRQYHDNYPSPLFLQGPSLVPRFKGVEKRTPKVSQAHIKQQVKPPLRVYTPHSTHSPPARSSQTHMPPLTSPPSTDMLETGDRNKQNESKATMTVLRRCGKSSRPTWVAIWWYEGCAA